MHSHTWNAISERAASLMPQRMEREPQFDSQSRSQREGEREVRKRRQRQQHQPAGQRTSCTLCLHKWMIIIYLSYREWSVRNAHTKSRPSICHTFLLWAASMSRFCDSISYICIGRRRTNDRGESVFVRECARLRSHSYSTKARH